MLTVMILARESRVSGIINCEEVAMRQRLEYILKVKMQENKTILIHLVNVNDDDPSATLVRPAESLDAHRQTPSIPCISAYRDCLDCTRRRICLT